MTASITRATPGALKATPVLAPDAAEVALTRAQLPLVGGFVLLVLVALASVWFAISSHRFNASVAHALQVRSKAYQLLTLVQDAETGQRGYLLTRDRAYLAPYLAGSREAPLALAELKRDVVGSVVQVQTLTRLDALIQAKLAELASTVAFADRNDFTGALALVKNDTGNNFMKDIRANLAIFEAEEVRSQDALTAAANGNNTLLALATLVGIALVIGLATYTVLLSRRALNALVGAQRRLRDANENLEGLVAERVSELQVANDEIQRFAYIVSHDLRAPLVNVMGFTSELDAARGAIAGFLKDAETAAPQLVTSDRRLAIEEDLPEALGFIRTSTSKMDRLINAILKLSREGRRVLTPQALDLRELVETQGASLSQQLSAGQAELVVQPDLPGLTSDRLAIEQIFGNLIENAIKYLQPDRPGRITVSGERHGAVLRYKIEDNGRGIDDKDFERIFELFRRSGEQDKPGEGIGLAYVRNLARRLGGNVTVQSQLAVGSTFMVTLPTAFQTKGSAR